MIRSRQLALLERARAQQCSGATEFADVLRRVGGADRVEELTASGFDAVMDHFTVRGFQDPARPVLSPRTWRLLDQVRAELDLSDFAYATALRARAGNADPRKLTGRGLLNMLVWLESCGLNVAAFNQARREVSDKQVRLVQVARKQLAVADKDYYAVLHTWGGVNSAPDLDRRGFDLVMAWMRGEGFEKPAAAPAGPSFGHRAGMASPEQVDLIRALWREWSGAGDEAALNAWLERFHHVSTLRFLSADAAAKAITGLKAMKRRKAAEPAA